MCFMIAGLLISCNDKNEKKPTIAVSIMPQKYLLERLVGDKYKVVSLLSQGSNPETFEPNAAHLLNLETSDAYFKIGNIGFELAISNRLKSNNPDLAVFDNSNGIEFITDSHNLGRADGNDEHHGHHHEIDPHIWSSVKNAKIISTNMLNALMELDPRNSNLYLINYKHLSDSLDALDKKIDSILAPVKGMKFAVWHPSLSYFARDYGLKQLSLQTANKEESIKGFKNKFDAVNTDSVLVFLYQAEFDSRQAEAVTSELGIKPIVINPMNPRLDEELIHTANAIVSGRK